MTLSQLWQKLRHPFRRRPLKQYHQVWVPSGRFGDYEDIGFTRVPGQVRTGGASGTETFYLMQIEKIQS